MFKINLKITILRRKFEPLIEFRSLKIDNVFTIAKVEGWLLKHEGLYGKLKSSWSCPNEDCYYQVTKHCSCENKHDELKFIELFKSLDKFTKYHKRENYAQQELDKYHNIKNDVELVEKWVQENEKVGDECFWFLIEHHDYDNNPVHLLIVNETLLGYRVFVDRSDFKYLIEFMEIFMGLKYKDDEVIDNG